MLSPGPSVNDIDALPLSYRGSVILKHKENATECCSQMIGFLVRNAGVGSKVTAVGFEPTQPALVELQSTPSDHSGKLS